MGGWILVWDLNDVWDRNWEGLNDRESHRKKKKEPKKRRWLKKDRKKKKRMPRKQLTPKEKKFVKAIGRGAESHAEAAREAGYAFPETTNYRVVERPLVRQELLKALQSRGIGPSRISNLLFDGLDANVVFMGSQTGVSDLPERRRWVEMICRIVGLIAPNTVNATFNQFNNKFDGVETKELIGLAADAMQRWKHIGPNENGNGNEKEQQPPIEAEVVPDVGK